MAGVGHPEGANEDANIKIASTQLDLAALQLPPPPPPPPDDPPPDQAFQPPPPPPPAYPHPDTVAYSQEQARSPPRDPGYPPQPAYDYPYPTERGRSPHKERMMYHEQREYARTDAYGPPPGSHHHHHLSRHSSPRRSPPRRSPPRRSPARRSPPRRLPPRHSPPRRSPPRCLPPRHSPPRRSPPRRSPPPHYYPPPPHRGSPPRHYPPPHHYDYLPPRPAPYPYDRPPPHAPPRGRSPPPGEHPFDYHRRGHYLPPHHPPPADHHYRGPPRPPSPRHPPPHHYRPRPLSPAASAHRGSRDGERERPLRHRKHPLSSRASSPSRAPSSRHQEGRRKSRRRSKESSPPSSKDEKPSRKRKRKSSSPSRERKSRKKDPKSKESESAPPTRTRARFHDESEPKGTDIRDIKRQLAKEIRASYTQCTQHGDLYKRIKGGDSTVVATKKLQKLYNKFESKLTYRHKKLLVPFEPFCMSPDAKLKKFDEVNLKGMVQITVEAVMECGCTATPTRHQRVKARVILKKLKKQAEKENMSLGAYLDNKRPSIPMFAIFTIKEALEEGSDESGRIYSSDDEARDDVDTTVREAGVQVESIRKMRKHPGGLHAELCFNAENWLNDGVMCQCLEEDKKNGIRHGVYPDEKPPPSPEPLENNLGKLYHYRLAVGPADNFCVNHPTTIEHDNNVYDFEGFSVFSYHKLHDLPSCDIIRYSIRYAICLIEEDPPENFTLRGVHLFQEYLFREILELYDWCNELAGDDDEEVDTIKKRRFHFYPRFVRDLEDRGKEILSLSKVLEYLLESDRSVISSHKLNWAMDCTHAVWTEYCAKMQGMIVTNPGKRPSSLRLDNLDRYDRIPLESGQNERNMSSDHRYPLIVHFGLRPAVLSYAGDPTYQRVRRAWLKQKHLMRNSKNVTVEDRNKYRKRNEALLRIKKDPKLQRDMTVEVSCYGFRQTGLFADICQHALLLPVFTHHMRYHLCLESLEDKIGYKFKNRKGLMHALSHPSCQMNFGLNPDHVRNALTNCGLRLPKYGNPSIHYKYQRKRGITTLIKIMAQLGKRNPSLSPIEHNERLEFLGDSVVGLLASLHLFRMLPDIAEGGLSSFRQALVNNRYLSQLAHKISLDKYMLFSHGPDLCRRMDLLHAMANCFEALMGAIYIESEDIEDVRPVFARLLWDNDPTMVDAWIGLPAHPLQVAEPWTDRHYIKEAQALQKLTKFEDSVGVRFNHIRLLAKAFTWRDVISYTHLTHGHNERLEFLGDSICNLVASTYLFKCYPVHHEGHLTLLRSCMVNASTQSIVAKELNMADYIIYNNRDGNKPTWSKKNLADLLEAFVAALYLDQGPQSVETFMNCCFFPRLTEFIKRQEWNDPKSCLQQCCLTLRREGVEPDLPMYRIDEAGQGNQKTFTCTVSFRDEVIGQGIASSVHKAQRCAAEHALQNSEYKFPQLDWQRNYVKKVHEERDGKDKKNVSVIRDVIEDPPKISEICENGDGKVENNKEEIPPTNGDFETKEEKILEENDEHRMDPVFL